MGGRGRFSASHVNPWIVTISAMMATFMIDKEFQSVMKPRPGSLFASVRL
jgi:hypothetical protein